jgi:hypothetical protein
VAKNMGYFCNLKKSAENNQQRGEKSPNLVTLIGINWKIQRPGNRKIRPQTIQIGWAKEFSTGLPDFSWSKHTQLDNL